jgi:transposase InsO family protein
MYSPTILKRINSGCYGILMIRSRRIGPDPLVGIARMREILDTGDSWSWSLTCLADLFVRNGPPEHIRSDYGSEFAAKAVRGWLERVGAKTLFIEPGSPWENGYCESFNGKLRDEALEPEFFYALKEAQVNVERWRTEYNTFDPTALSGIDHLLRKPFSKRSLSRICRK